MSKTLVLAEKPSVARDIARVLKCEKKLNGALEGSKYVVTWALGHLVTLADPEVYNKKYKVWDMQDLPMLPEHMKLVVIKQTNKQFQAVKTQMMRSDVNEIVIATDAGREGELVARWIIEKVGIKKNLKRLWISSVTDKAIIDGFNHLKNAKDYEPLYHSALARSEADWLVGINATRALTCKYNAQLSCGRVQTPTLAMIQAREEEIKNFKAKPFYSLEVQSDGMTWHWQRGNLFDLNKVQNIKDSLNGKQLTITDIKTAQKKKYSPQLYDLTELQRDANQMYGYSAKETLNIMQNLYEYHKVLTYPRTDSRYLTDDIVPTLKERLEASLGGDFDEVIQQILSKPIKKQAHFVNNSKVSDHHAIIPTEQEVYFDSFSDGEKKIYTLVLKRFLQVLLPAYEYEETTMVGLLNHELFSVKGKMIKSLGWKQLSSTNQKEDDMQIVVPLQVGHKVDIQQIILNEGQTKAPAYYTEATLLSAMENPSTSSKQAHQTLVQTGGLGTVATRADIIEKLFNTFLIEKRNQEIHVTAKGRQLLNLVPHDLRTPELTAKWENELTKISKGERKPQQFIKEICHYTQNIITEIAQSDAKFKHDNITSKKCPNCGEPLLEVNGKKGKMLVCSNRECGYKQSVSIITNARCPNCHKKLELVGPKDKQMFVCKSCGYRQQMNAFKKEREDKKNSAGKNDVRKYMKQQKAQEKASVEDSPFALLLALKDQM